MAALLIFMRGIAMNYTSLSDYLKARFGCKVYKLALEGGMTCPNRDGTCGDRGCIFCGSDGSGQRRRLRCILYGSGEGFVFFCGHSAEEVLLLGSFDCLRCSRFDGCRRSSFRRLFSRSEI